MEFFSGVEAIVSVTSQPHPGTTSWSSWLDKPENSSLKPLDDPRKADLPHLSENFKPDRAALLRLYPVPVTVQDDLPASPMNDRVQGGRGRFCGET